jgi:hypothetical protein
MIPLPAVGNVGLTQASLRISGMHDSQANMSPMAFAQSIWTAVPDRS